MTVVDATGRVVSSGLAVPAAREAGDQSVAWNGLAKNGNVVPGTLTVRVVATSSLGRSELDAPITSARLPDSAALWVPKAGHQGG